jgi:hypothetical protein
MGAPYIYDISHLRVNWVTRFTIDLYSIRYNKMSSQH